MKQIFFTTLLILVSVATFSTAKADDLDWIEEVASKQQFWGTIMISERTTAGGSYGYATSVEDAISKTSGIQGRAIQKSLDDIENFYAAEARAKRACQRGVETLVHLKNSECRLDDTFGKRVVVIAGYHRFLIDVSYTAKPVK